MLVCLPELYLVKRNLGPHAHQMTQHQILAITTMRNETVLGIVQFSQVLCTGLIVSITMTVLIFGLAKDMVQVPRVLPDVIIWRKIQALSLLEQYLKGTVCPSAVYAISIG